MGAEEVSGAMVDGDDAMETELFVCCGIIVIFIIAESTSGLPSEASIPI